MKKFIIAFLIILFISTNVNAKEVCTITNSVKVCKDSDEKHNYGVKRILEWACVSHFIELIEARNILDLKKDIDNIVENFEEKHKDNLENAIFESHWEPKFESNVGKKISSELSKKAKNSLSREQFDKQVESITSLSLLSEDDKNKLVQENAKKIKEQLSEKLQKLKSPKP